MNQKNSLENKEILLYHTLDVPTDNKGVCKLTDMLRGKGASMIVQNIDMYKDFTDKEYDYLGFHLPESLDRDFTEMWHFIVGQPLRQKTCYFLLGNKSKILNGVSCLVNMILEPKGYMCRAIYEYDQELERIVNISI